MRPVRISYAESKARKAPHFLFYGLSFLFVNYELFRTLKGAHPLGGLNRSTPSDPRSEEPQSGSEAMEKALREYRAKSVKERNESSDSPVSDAPSVEKNRQPKPTEKKGSSVVQSEAEPSWTYVNGIPIPTYNMLTKPFRR